MTHYITFTDVTSDQVWDLLMAVKLRIRRLEEMVVSEVFNDKQKADFDKELDNQRHWETLIMNAYLKEQLTVKWESAIPEDYYISGNEQSPA
jgi:hypothetical protein